MRALKSKDVVIAGIVVAAFATCGLSAALAENPVSRLTSLLRFSSAKSAQTADAPGDVLQEAPKRAEQTYPYGIYPHYECPNRYYGVWYRPRSFGLNVPERCTPDYAFRPRGFGDLGAEPHTLYRMDYHPYVLANPDNRFGPSYYHREPSLYCDDYKGCGCCGCLFGCLHKPGCPQAAPCEP